MDISEKQPSKWKDVVGCGAVLLVLVVVIIAILLCLGPVVGNTFSNFPDNRITMDAVAQAWIDENENGIWEPHESPLPGVEFSITYDIGSWVDDPPSAHAKSDWRGLGHFPEVRVGVGCLDRTEVYAKAPAGY